MSDDDITEDKPSRRVERSNGIGCWPPPSPDTEDLSFGIHGPNRCSPFGYGG